MKEHCIIVAGGKVGEKIPPHPPLRIYYINSNLEELLNVYLPKSERPTLRPTLFCLTFGVHFKLIRKTKENYQVIQSQAQYIFYIMQCIAIYYFTGF
jgi:hypothetical protein